MLRATMIVLLGASGYIGSAFAREMASRYLNFRALSRAQADYTRFDRLYDFLKQHRREIRFLINAAGLCGRPNVDELEYRKADALLANVVLPVNIAAACSILEIPWAQISSGCIFDGYPVMGWSEAHVPNFTFRDNRHSWYSGTKALAEEALRGVGRSYVWRLRMPFSEVAHPKNLISKLLGYRMIFDSPANSLSHLGESVKACMDLWEGGAPYGIWNITNPGTATNREIVEMIQRILKPEREFEFFHSEAAFEAETAAPRSNCILDSRKLAAAGVKLQDVREALQESLDNWKSAAP